MLGNFAGHLLGGLFLLKVCALLAGAVASQAVRVDIACLQLLYQLCHKDCSTDVVKRENENIAAMCDASKPIVVQTLVEELP